MVRNYKRLLITVLLVFSISLGAQARLGFDLFSPTTLQTVSTQQQIELFELTQKVMENRALYKYLNRVFSSQLQISPEKQKAYGWPEKSKGLSSTQVMFLLQSLREEWQMLKTYLESVNETNFSQPEIKNFRDEMRKRFSRIFSDKNLAEKFKSLNDPTEPLEIQDDRTPGYEAMEIFVNHSSLVNPFSSASAASPATDLKALVIDFIKGAKHSLIYNVFEFNLMDIAHALKEQNNMGVDVMGGIDLQTTSISDPNSAVFTYLKSHESLNFKTVAVNSSGLNHQKIIVRDAGTPEAAILLLSGNFTQSCIGPEGDAVTTPTHLRPRESLPNANHALFVKGALPALTAKYELQKTLLKGLRGQSDYPIGGSYLFYGPRIKHNEPAPYFLLSFSPNGGMGEVNRDIIKRVILSTRGPIWTMQFAFSSPELIEAITTRLKQAKQKNALLDFRAAGDPPFALREWSAFLKLSGMQRDLTTKVYSSDPASEIRSLLNPQQLRIWQSKIRVNPKVFGEFNVRNLNGEHQRLSVKLHHKVFIFPQDQVAIVGTSFNPSRNAEGNQEQIAVVSDPKVVNKIAGAFSYLYSQSKQSVANMASKRNLYLKFQKPSEEETPSDLEASMVTVQQN